MLLGVVFDNPETLQKIVLILNTILLIGALLVYEFAFAHASKTKKKRFKLLYPILFVMVGILGYAAYKQGGA
ncbi:MAG TPA: hypothetical protein VFT16_00325 [Candidatus Saccharimonadales bacterium]|nr:hypothetical protein [Candidatus Saccharimonadales bacterium]